MRIGTITRLLFILVMVVGFAACDQLQQLLLSGPPETETPTPIEERDHVWVVDQNGVEVPIPGTWVLVEHTNPNSTYVIGESFTLTPRDTAPDFAVRGNVYGRRRHPLDKGEHNCR